jgi:phage-related minor tail protein
VRIETNFDAVSRAAERLQSRLAEMTRPAVDGAQLMGRAFARSFDTLERTLARAARTGQFSMRGMVDAILADLSRLAIQTFITAPLEAAFSHIGKSLFGGARAAGGPVAPGRAYLVGERGPELFMPSGHGQIDPQPMRGRGGITVNVTARDAESVMRSQAQLAAALRRAVIRGARNA